jgi:PTS system mannose-specific IID component
MEPGLQMLYKDSPDKYLEARKRYLSHYNSHPYLLPFLVGYFLFLESRISQGIISPNSLNAIKETSAYTLSAIGDSFFGGSLLVGWALIEILFLLYNLKFQAVAFFFISFLLLQAFRFTIFWKGWNQGLSFFQYMREINLIEWSNRIKMVNAVLLVWIWKRISYLYMSDHFVVFVIGGIVFALLSYLVRKFFVPREVLFIIGLLVIILFF